MHPAPLDTRPLVVDLDGALLPASVLADEAGRALRREPTALASLIVSALRGRLRGRLGELVAHGVADLPWRAEVLERLRAARAAGRRTVLLSTVPESLTRACAAHHGLFDEVLCLEGGGRAEALERYDLGGAERVAPAGQAPEGRGSGEAGPLATMRELLRCLRPAHWIKNSLLFVPLVASHRLLEVELFGRALLAFLAFSLVASSGYLLNDLLDLGADRRHPRKSQRPLAAGSVSVGAGLVLLPLVLILGFALASAVGEPLFVVSCVVYLVLTVSYSLALKSRPIVDVIVLTSLYSLRILAGGAAAGIEPTSWLLTFSLFFFLDLAFLKRYSELSRVAGEGRSQAAGRGYTVEDLRLFEVMGPIAGYLSVLVFCLYLDSDDVVVLYSQPKLLLLVTPILVYWITRAWFLARRGVLHDEPLSFAVRDRASWLTVLLAVALVLWARALPVAS